MKTYPLNEARADFSKLIERALAGEPCRVTRYGKEAVVIVAEATWNERARSAATLGALLADYAESEPADESSAHDEISARPWKERPLGTEVE